MQSVIQEEAFGTVSNLLCCCSLFFFYTRKLLVLQGHSTPWKEVVWVVHLSSIQFWKHFLWFSFTRMNRCSHNSITMNLQVSCDTDSVSHNRLTNVRYTSSNTTQKLCHSSSLAPWRQRSAAFPFSMFLVFVWLKTTMHNETQPSKSPSELLLSELIPTPHSLRSDAFLHTIVFYCSAKKYLVKVKFPSAASMETCFSPSTSQSVSQTGEWGRQLQRQELQPGAPA